MPRMDTKLLLRRTAWIVAALVVLLAAAAAVLVATFDADRYKGVAIDWMKTERDRSLAIDGPLKLSVFPRIEVKVSKLRLSEKGRPDEFLAVDDAALALRLWPLLSRRAVVERIEASGVRVRIVRDAKGAANFDDLVGARPQGAPPAPASVPAPPDAQPMAFDVSRIALRDVRVSVRDAAARVAGDVGLKSLTSGRLAPGERSPVSLEATLALTEPALRGDLAGKTTLALDLARKAVQLDGTKLTWRGDAFGLKALDATVEGDLAWDGQALAARDVSLGFGAVLGELKLAGSSLKLDAFRYDPAKQQLALESLRLALAGQRAGDPLKLTLDWPRLEATADGLKGSALGGSLSIAGAHKLDGTFRSQAPVGHFEQFRVPQLALDVSGTGGPRSIRARIGADLTVRAGQGTVAFDALSLQASVQEPSLQPLAIEARGRAGYGGGKASLALAGEINRNRFDLDAHAAFGGRVPNVKAQAHFDVLDLNRVLASGAGATSAPAPSGPAPADTPVALDALNALDGQFAFSAGTFTLRQYRVTDARLDATLAGGMLRIGRLTGRAWGGTVDASGSADAKSGRVALKLAASGVDTNALLKDVAGKDLLEGRGRVNADVSSQGRSVGQLRSQLDGTVALDLRDGAIKGFNVARALRQAKAALSLKQDAVAKASAAEKTDFSELTVSARIADGVASSDDLQLKSPFLRIGGAGQFDIGRGRVDYVARATVADTSKGQGGAELDALRGVTVPVRLSGPFDAIDWKVQWSGVAAAAVESRLKDKLGEKLGLKPAAPADPAASAPAQPKSAKDALKEKLLKGLMK